MINKAESIREWNELRKKNKHKNVNPQFFEESVWPTVLRGLEMAKNNGIMLNSNETYPTLILGDQERWKTKNSEGGSEIVWGYYDGKRQNLDVLQIAYLMGQLNQETGEINVFLLPESRKTKELLIKMSREEKFLVRE